MAQKIVQSDWQQRVDYSIDVQLDDKQHVLHGHIAMQYTNNSPYALSEVYMHLWPNGYKNNRTAFGKQMKENREMDFYYSEKDERGYMDSVAFLVNGETVQIEKN